MAELFHEAEFWVAVAFVVFIGVLLYFGYRRIVGLLDGRAEKIKEELEGARSLREEAQALLANYQRRQRDAEKEAEEIAEHAKAEAKRVADEAEANLQGTIQRRTQMAMDKIARAEAQALEDVRNTAVDVAVSAASKLIEKNLDTAKAATLVDEAISDLDKKLH